MRVIDKRTEKGQTEGQRTLRRIHNQVEYNCHCYFTHKFMAVGCVKYLTLLSGDVWLVPELGRVLDKLDIHLNVWITICLDSGDRKNDNCRGHKRSVR